MAMGKDVLTFLVPGLEKKNQLVETAVKKNSEGANGRRGVLGGDGWIIERWHLASMNSEYAL